MTFLPSLQVHSLVFANSGTLLLCLLDTSRIMAGFRQRIRSAFPGKHWHGALQ